MVRKQLIGIFGDPEEANKIKHALEELDGRESRPSIPPSGVDPSMLGMGSGISIPDEPDFLDKVPPWAGHPGIQ